LAPAGGRRGHPPRYAHALKRGPQYVHVLAAATMALAVVRAVTKVECTVVTLMEVPRVNGATTDGASGAREVTISVGANRLA
jgi:hypothetical protein